MSLAVVTHLISRRRLVIFFFITLAVLLLAFRRLSSRRQPYIVFILADDLSTRGYSQWAQGWNDVSYNGCPQIRTPNIDALAWNGIRLQRYYTQPLCTPSRAALMTGRYPIHTGTQHFVILQSEPRGLPLHFKLLPQWLGDLGYASQMLGKWHLGFYKKEYTPTMRGFQNHIGSWGGFVDYYSHQREADILGGKLIGLDFHQGLSEAREFNGKYYTQLITEEATRAIKNHPLGKVPEHAA